MIRLFNANETNFDHYETILTDVLSFESEEEENGIFYCEMTCPLDDRIQEGKIIKAPTARGEQLFRIVKVNKNVPAMTLYVYGRHIFYDLLDNFLLNIRPTDKTLNNALADILSGAEYAHPFTATSDVPGLKTANYVRMNPVAAIMGSQDNSALNLWGGFLKRNNFTIQVLATSPDKGYEVRFGKNLLGADEELDMTEVVTRFYPTVVIEEPAVTALPEKYVDSPLIDNYPYPIIKEYRIPLTDDEKLLPIADIYQLMRDRCAEQYTLKADLPKTNYKIDFVQLRKTEQYKHLAILEELDISDTVWVYVDPLNLNMSSRMIKYRHDGIHDRFLSMELGNFKPKLTNQKTEFKALIESATKELTDGTITTMLKNAVDRIQGNFGGNVVTITVDGKPVAVAFMDTDDVNTANEYIIINNKGIAFGKNGLNNPPELAIDIDGSIVGDSAFFRSLTTNLIQSEIGQSLDLSSNESITLKVTQEVGEVISTAPIYTWIKYADDDQGTGMSDNPAGKTYLGLAHGKTTQTASDNPLDYTWSKIQGDAGADGVSSWIRYSNDKINMSTTDAGQRWIGIYVGLTQSSNPQDYAWFDRSEIPQDISSRNLALLSDNPKSTTAYLVGTYKLSRPLGVGKTYSVYLKGTLGIGKTYYGIWVNGATFKVGDLSKDGDRHKLTFVMPAGAPVPPADGAEIRIYSQPSSTIANSTVDWLTIVEGSLPLSDKSTAPEDGVKTTTGSLTNDGFTVEDTVDHNKTTIKPDGMVIQNKETGETLLTVESDSSTMSRLFATDIHSDTIVRARGNFVQNQTITRYLGPAATGTGSGESPASRSDDFLTCLRSALNYGLVLKNAEIVIDVAPGTYTGLWRIQGITGYGKVRINFAPGVKMIGHIDIYDCTVDVILTAGTTGGFIQTKGDLTNCITILNCHSVYLERPVIIHPNAVGYPIYITNSNVVISSYDITGDGELPVRAIYADYNSQVYAMFGRGNTQNGAFFAGRGSIITAAYGIPMPAATANPDADTTTGTYFAKSTTRTVSTAVAPPITWQTATRTFTADLWRIQQATGWRSDGEMAQGTSPNDGKTYRGYAAFGRDIYDYLRSNGGYQNITSIKLIADRGGWGYGDDALKITAPAARTTPLTARYGSSTTELFGYALANSVEMSTDLTLSTSTTAVNEYSNWTKIRIQISCQKRV